MQWHIHEIQQNEEDKRDEFKGKTFFDVERFYSGGDCLAAGFGCGFQGEKEEWCSGRLPEREKRGADF